MAAQHHDATLNEDGPYTTPLDSTQLGELGAGAERDMTLKLSSTTALHGDAAATFGRDLLLERATGG